MKGFEYNFNINKEDYNNIVKHVYFNSNKKEKEIFDKLVERKSCKLIANETGYSLRTVQNRRAEIYNKIENYLPEYLKINSELRPRENINKLKFSLTPFVVYILIFPNNKVYIGQTCDIKTRWSGNGIGYKQNKEMYKDIQEYGWQNITKKVIFRNLTLQQSLDKEKEMIIRYRSNIPLYGYNKDF